MTHKLRVSREAEEDLQDIWGYLSEFDEAAADRIVDTIAAAYRSLLDYPFKGRTREEILPGLRSLVVGRYVIFYRLVDEFVLVSRILHGARDLGAVFVEDGADDSM